MLYKHPPVDLRAIRVEAGNALKRAGADFLVLCTNTMHKFGDALEEKVGLPLLHIVDITGKAITDSGLHRVGLLGTQLATEDSFYLGRLERRFSTDVLIPAAQERAAIDRTVVRIIDGLTA